MKTRFIPYVVSIIILAISGSLVGCAKQECKEIGRFNVGTKTYVGGVVKDRDPWGHDNSIVFVTESDNEVVEEQPPQQPVAETLQNPCGNAQIETCQTQTVSAQQQVQYKRCKHAMKRTQCGQTTQVLTNTHPVDFSNQGGPGWINNNLGRVVIGGGLGYGLHGAKFGGGGSSSSSSSAAASSD
jgi:hypothetical protein